MRENDQTKGDLDALWRAGDAPALARYLIDHSHLPGPRANLGLAQAFARTAAAQGFAEERLALLVSWLPRGQDDVTDDGPSIFLPFCAIQAISALYPSADAANRRVISDALRGAASDPRWRVRESVVLGWQIVAEIDWQCANELIDEWLRTPTLYERRAIIGALAHSPILKQPDRVRKALVIVDDTLKTLETLPDSDRRRQDAKTLAQTLGFALSVYVAALPDEGFAALRRWASIDDPVVQRVIRANLGKARLAKKHAARVAEVAALLDGD